MKVNNPGSLVFNLLLTAFVLTFMLFCFRYERAMRMIPLFVGIPTLLFLVLSTIQECFITRNKMEEGASKDTTELRPVLRLIGWIIVFSVAIFFCGFYLSMILFTFLFLLIEANLKWNKSIMMTIIVSVSIYVLFHISLKVVLWPGIIPEIVGDLLGGGISAPL